MHFRHFTKEIFNINYFLAIDVNLTKYLSFIVFKFSSKLSFNTGPHDDY